MRPPAAEPTVSKVSVEMLSMAKIEETSYTSTGGITFDLG